jgi:hypothetical protein
MRDFRDFLRTALLCMLLVAVPLQGLAAGAMLFCGSVQGSDAVSIDSHSHTDQGTAQAHHHQQAGDGAPSGSAQHAGGHDDALQPLGHLHDGTCSVCASCCSGAALPQSAAMLVSQAEQRAPRVDSSQPDPGHACPGPERPPRRLLA